MSLLKYGSLVQWLEPPAHNGADLNWKLADRQGVKQSKKYYLF